MNRVLKYLTLGFLAGFSVSFIAFAFPFGWEQAMVMAVVTGGVYSLFCLGFMARLMKTATLKITPANKDPQKGMAWYEEQIRQHIVDMRFKRVGNSSTFEVYHPVGFKKVWERKIEFVPGIYEVKVTGSRIMIRVLSDLVEVKPEG